MDLGNAEASRYRFDDVEVDVRRRRVLRNGAELALEPKAHAVLVELLRHAGDVVARDALLDAVWGTTFEGYEHNVNTHINRLRSKIETDPANPRYVLTVRGVGYRFTDQR